MANKKMAVALLAAVLAFGITGVSAYAIDIGGGGLLDLSFNNGVKGPGGSMGYRLMSVGAYGFADFGLAEVSLGIASGSLTLVTDLNSGGKSTDDIGSGVGIDLNVLGKLPMNMKSYILFPLLGFSYNLVVSAKDENGNAYDDDPAPTDFSQFGILAGVGADFFMTRTLFVRAEGLLHFRFASQIQKDWASSSSNLDPTVGFGPRIKVAVGMKM